MSDWGDITPINEGDQGWGDVTPAPAEPKYKPDPVVAPPPAFLKRFATGETKTGQDLKAIGDAFKTGYGEEPIIAWRPEDIKALQDWGIINAPNNVDPDSAWSAFTSGVKSLNELGLRAIPGIPDTIMRGINGLGAASSEFLGQTAAGVVGAVKPEASQKAHDTVAGMSWEAIQTWFLYEMSNGAGFGRPKPNGSVEPVGSLPRQSQFDNAAKLLGDKKLEPNLKKTYNSQGITPAEVFNDAQKDVTITQDVITGKPIKAYEPPKYSANDWVARNVDTILQQNSAEFKASVKNAGLDYDEVVDVIASQPEVAGRWTDAMNQRAIEARVRDMHPEAYDLYQTLEQQKLEASNKVEELKAAKEEAIYGEIDKQIEETQARLTAEGGQGKRYKVYQKRLDELKQQRNDMQLANQQGAVLDDYNRNIQEARMEWLKYDQQQRTLVPVLGKARKQAIAELEAIQPSELPLKEDIVNQSPQPQQPQQTPNQAVQATQQPLGNAPQALGGGGQPPANPPVGAANAATQPTPQITIDQARTNIASQINVGGKGLKEKLSWNKFYTRYVDQFNPVRVAIRDALKAVGLDYKNIKNTASDPYVWFRLTKGTFGKVNSFLNYATRDYSTYQINGYSLKDIIKPVANDLNDLRNYIAARRALELESRGIQSGFDIPSAQMVVQADQARFEPIHRQLVDFQNRITEYLKDSGILSEEGYQAMLQANQEYTPFYRYFEDMDTPIGKNVSSRLGAKNPIKGIEGSEQGIIDPLESIIRNTYTYIALADKNSAGLKLVDLMNHLNANYLQVVPTGPTNGLSQIAQTMRHSSADNMIAVWRDGVPEVYRVVNNPDLVKAWQGLDQYTASQIVKVLALPAKTLRAGATLNLDFMARNLIRDTLTAFATAGTHPINTTRGFYNAFLKTRAYQDWQAAGGNNAALVSLDRNYLQNNLRDIIDHTGMTKRVWGAVAHPLDSLRATSELFENVTRLGTYLKGQQLLQAGTRTKGQMIEAAFKSREATLDFARMGTQIRAVNMLDAFLNANIQGLDRVVRSFKDDPLGTGVRIAAGITLPSIYLWMANHKDPRYQHAHDWEKDLYWMVMTDNWQPMNKADADKQNIPAWNRRIKNGKLEVQMGHTYKFPKPFEIGIMFGSLPERMLDNMYDNNKKSMDAWKKDTMEAMIPQLIPQVLGAPIEGITNYSFFTGSPVVPDYLKQQLPEYQYTEYTSETAKLLGKMFGAIPGIKDAKANPNAPLNGLAQQIASPLMLENYVRDWFGGLGTTALKVADAGLKNVAGVGADKIEPAKHIEDMPFIKSFMIRNPSSNPQSVSDFKAHNTMNNTIMATIKAQANAGNISEYEKLMKAYGIRSVLNQTQKAISDHYKLIGTIYNDNTVDQRTGKPRYTANDKRQLIDSIYYAIDQMATEANKMLDAEDKFIEEYKSKHK